MSYVDKHLHPGERIVHRGAFHWLRPARAWLALILLGVFLVGIVIFVYEMLRMKTTDFAVTNHRIMHKRGILTADVEELALDAIEGGMAHQSMLGRLFGYGHITVAGRGEMEIAFPTMARPERFYAAITQAREALRESPAEEVVNALEANRSSAA